MSRVSMVVPAKRTILKDIFLRFNIPKGAIVVIVSANGAGKSTLFKMLSGVEQERSRVVNRAGGYC